MTAVSTITVRSPFTGEIVGKAPAWAPHEIAAALERAAAYENELSRHERSQLLFALADHLTNDPTEWAELIAGESGLCLKDTVHEVGRAVDVFRFAAIEALNDDGATFSGDVSAGGCDRRAHTLSVPVRLVAAITPFNHPLGQVAHKLAPAIAAARRSSSNPPRRPRSPR